MTDGLSQLAARGRRTREIPPPRNPARTAPVQLTSVPAPEPEEEPAAAQAPAVEAPAAERSDGSPAGGQARPEAGARPAPAPKPRRKAELKVVTVYLEQDDDDFLETITHTGRTSQPKTAISRSAVVRLALERLHAQMSPEQIVNELRPRGTPRHRPQTPLTRAGPTVALEGRTEAALSSPIRSRAVLFRPLMLDHLRLRAGVKGDTKHAARPAGSRSARSAEILCSRPLTPPLRRRTRHPSGDGGGVASASSFDLALFAGDGVLPCSRRA